MNSLKTIFKDALPTLEKFSPSIAAALGGVPGFALSVVVPILAKTFGVDSHNLNDLASAILKDEHASVKLQGLENQHHDWLCAVTDSVSNLASAELHLKLDWHKKLF